MRSKLTLLIAAFALVALLAVGSASAFVPNRAPCANCLAYGYASYGSYPVNPSIYNGYMGYTNQNVRIGGWYGANSAFLIGLKPGVFDSPVMNYRTRQAIASSNYPRVGGRFGSYYGLRGGYIGGYSGGYTGRYSTPSFNFHGPL